jgi:hypothetical protein
MLVPSSLEEYILGAIQAGLVAQNIAVQVQSGVSLQDCFTEHPESIEMMSSWITKLPNYGAGSTGWCGDAILTE